MLGKSIELYERCVGRAVHIHRIRFEANLRTVDRDRLDLVKQHDRWPVGCGFGDRLRE